MPDEDAVRRFVHRDLTADPRRGRHDTACCRVEHNNGAVRITRKRAVCVAGHEDAAGTPGDGESGGVANGNGRDRRPGCGVEDRDPAARLRLVGPTIRDEEVAGMGVKGHGGRVNAAGERCDERPGRGIEDLYASAAGSPLRCGRPTASSGRQGKNAPESSLRTSSGTVVARVAGGRCCGDTDA